MIKSHDLALLKMALRSSGIIGSDLGFLKGLVDDGGGSTPSDSTSKFTNEILAFGMLIVTIRAAVRSEGVKPIWWLSRK
jgi:hypothetical protein